MNEIIQISKNAFVGSREIIDTVNARELHAFLEVKTAFKDWMARRVEDYGFSEGKDFCSFLSESTGGRPSIEYCVTIDMAKELSMVERNEKGKQARQYFIECERVAKSQPATLRLPTNFEEAIESLLVTVRSNKALAARIEADRPKVEFAEAIGASQKTIKIEEFAKSVSRHGSFIVGRNTLFQILRDKHILMNGFKSKNLPFQKYIDSGWFEVVERVYENANSNGPRINFTTLVTGKGQIAITRILKEHFRKAA